MVVDFAVAHDDHAPVFVTDRLLATGYVDNAQPAHTECQIALYVDARVIRPAMADHLCHIVEGLPVCRRLGLEVVNAANTTHFAVSFRLGALPSRCAPGHLMHSQR